MFSLLPPAHSAHFLSVPPSPSTLLPPFLAPSSFVLTPFFSPILLPTPLFLPLAIYNQSRLIHTASSGFLPVEAHSGIRV